MTNTLIKDTLKEIISEATKINFAGHTFMLRTGVNEDPNKKGIKVQFIPTEFGTISVTDQNDIAIELEKRLEDGLKQYDIKIERDRELKDKTKIGFFIYLEHFDKMIRKALGHKPAGEKTDDGLDSADNATT